MAKRTSKQIQTTVNNTNKNGTQKLTQNNIEISFLKSILQISNLNFIFHSLCFVSDQVNPLKSAARNISQSGTKQEVQPLVDKQY
jgi:hypothetical protein